MIVMAFSFEAVLKATLVVGIVGLLIGIVLGFAGSIFEVKKDEKEEKIRACLPGNNCGGCGYPGCDGCAHAIFLGEAPVNQCPVGGPKVAAEIAKVMGVADVPKTEARKAYVRKSDCVGCTLCQKTCAFDSVHVVNKKATVNLDTCKGCGACAAKCPKKAIDLMDESKARELFAAEPKEEPAAPAAAAPEKAAAPAAEPQKAYVRKADCVGCTLCQKTCPFDSVHVENRKATVNQDTCMGCGACAAKCPKKAIDLMDESKARALADKEAAEAAAGAAVEAVKAEAGKAAEAVKAEAGKAAEAVKSEAGKAAEAVKAEAEKAVETVKAEADQAAEAVEEVAQEADEVVKEVKMHGRTASAKPLQGAPGKKNKREHAKSTNTKRV